jgi:hypothetical protein
VVIMAVTGSILIVGEPTRSLPSFEFQMKMLFLAVALALTFLFTRSVRLHPDRWADNSAARTAHSTLAVVALAAWCAMVIWGRWIAYTVVH